MATCENEMGMHAHRKLKLLVVDDDPNTRALLQDALEIRGAEVLASASVREAADALRTWQPDLLISDIGMPVDDGYELIRRLRDAPTAPGRRTPVIACTSHAAADDRERALNAGFDALIAKPIDLDLLMDTIVHFTTVGASGGRSDAAGDAVASLRAVGSGAGGRGRSAPDS